MSTEENKAIVRRHRLEMCGQGSAAQADEIFTSKITVGFQNSNTTEVTPDFFKQNIIEWREAFPDTYVTIEGLIAEGDEVAERWIWGGTHKGEFWSIPPTGKQAAVMGQREYEFWTSEENLSKLGGMMGRFARKNLPGIKERLKLVEDDDEVIPGIRVLEAYGHTPGHLGLEIQSQGEVLLHLADVALHPLHLEHPEWCAKVDLQPDQMVATRKRLLEEAARHEVKVLLFHFDFPSIGYVVGHDGAWRWKLVTEE